jgi:hypothetical protein
LENTTTMRTILIVAGTTVHMNGIPVKLTVDTKVTTHEGNVPLLTGYDVTPPADAPPAETPQPIHNSCHEVWCNGSRHEPRGAKGYSCSCRPRGSIADKAAQESRQ